MKKFSTRYNNEKCEINYTENGELEIKFDLKFSDKNNDEISVKGIALNPDPEGFSSFEEFDPSGDFNSMEMFIYKTKSLLIKILIPLEELEDEYIGITIESEEGKSLFDGMLTKENEC